MIEHFLIAGRILDPCRGEGVFHDRLPGADWCEIQQGRDFFSQAGPYDWIVGNPPYSIYAKWLRHSMEIAENSLYLIPLSRILASDSMIKHVWRWGGICEIMFLGKGGDLGFPIDFAVGAVHYQRGYAGPITMTV